VSREQASRVKHAELIVLRMMMDSNINHLSIASDEGDSIRIISLWPLDDGGSGSGG
jgi:hypothetical protein